MFRKTTKVGIVMKMHLHKERICGFPFHVFLAILLTIMFVVTIILTFKLLNNEYCNCQPHEAVIEYLAMTKKLDNQVFHSMHKLAVLVPFRDRFEELLEFAPYIHNFLNAQRINHDIFILNQVDSYRFNRASLINVGYLQTKASYDYLVMHDVDLLPLNNNLSYAYPSQPCHLAAPNLHPRYHYNKFIGSILLMNREQFQLVNGLSNKYWGWGLEDDEFYVRIKEANLNITRPEHITTGINNTFSHIHGRERKRDTAKCYNQREVTRKRDRITGLHDVKYSIVNYRTMTIGTAPLTVISIKLACDRNITPWCDCVGDKTGNRNKSKVP